MFEYLSEFAIIVSTIMLLFGLYCLYFLQTGGYKPALILPILGLVAGIAGCISKHKKSNNPTNDETDEPKD